jgi:peptide/nickel transport system permease protein
MASRSADRSALADWFHRAADSDIWWSFKSSSMTVVAAAATLFIVVVAFLSPVLAPHTPFDPATLSLSDGLKPPVLISDDGEWSFPLGTDDQGRDVLSSIMYGTRLSLEVGFASVVVAMLIGISLGLVSGYVGGTTDAVIMRIADVQLTFPAILTALLIDGAALAIFKGNSLEVGKFWILVLSIGLSYWVQYARVVRGVTLVERNKEYVQAARLIGIGQLRIMFQHVLPNVLGPVLVIATINLALAVITEATLSFLGVGLPPTQPSLGTMIQVGNRYLFSGSWWMVAFPGLTLALLAVAVNLLGDWLRDALNPRLR